MQLQTNQHSKILVRQGGWKNSWLTILLLAGLALFSVQKASASCHALFNTASTTAAPNTIYFSDSSTGSNITSWVWSFGDGTVGYGRRISHTYSANGTYTACLTIIDSVNNCRDTFCRTISISGMANCQADFSRTVYGKTVSFHNSSLGNLTSYQWSFGDGTSSTDPNPQHTYSRLGFYYVCLTVKDSVKNCSSTKCDSVYINDSSCSWANFAYDVHDSLVYFRDSSIYLYDTANTQWTWSFGDGTSSSIREPYHVFPRAGSYQVCLTIKDTVHGCYSSYCQLITVKTGVKCAVSFTYTHSGPTYYFTSHGSSNIDSFYWRFDYRDSSLDTNPTYTFSNSGTHVVMLWGFDKTSGCQAMYYDTISYYYPCYTKFSTIVNGRSVTFKPTQQDSNWKYTWTFGDGAGSSKMLPMHKYAYCGYYPVCLNVDDSANDCHSQYCGGVYVQGNNLSGSVTTGNTVPSGGYVYLITYDASDSSLKAVDTARIFADSGRAMYWFSCLDSGVSYYVKAALDSTDSLYSKYVPTYYISSKKWKNADAVVLSNTDATNIDIDMKKGHNTGGPGFIAGKVSQGANKVGDPLSGIQVMLVDENDEPVAYTYSDKSGMFSFSNIALGTYKVYAEVLGLDPVEGTVTLTENRKSVDNVDIEVGSKMVVTSIWMPGKNASALPITLYPNPTNGMLNLALTNDKYSHAVIYVYNYTGQLVMQKAIELQPGIQNIPLDMTHVPQGVYQIRMQSSGSNALWEGRFSKTK